MNGLQYPAKRKKPVTEQYDKKLFILFYALTKVSGKFPTCAWSATCSSNVKRRVGNFLHHAKLVCLLPLSECLVGQRIGLVGNFHNYNVLLKSYASLLSLSLSLKLTQHNVLVEWDSLTLALFGGKKKFGLVIFMRPCLVSAFEHTFEHFK